MANTKLWPDPDTQYNEQGREDVQAVYVLSPSTQKPTELGSASLTNDGSFAKETGGNLASIKSDLDEIALDTDNLASSLTQQTNINTILGATGDTAVVGDTAGTLSAKLRGLSKLLNDMWDSVNHRLNVAVQNANNNGQATMANSAPVVIASDQAKLPTKAASGDFVAGSIADLAHGQAAMAASVPVVIASDQSKLPTKAAAGDFVDGSLATIGAQADASAAADNSTASLMSLFKRLLAKFPQIGPQAKASSVSVTFATDNPKAGVTAASGDFADGAITTMGLEADSAITNSASSGTLMAFLKGIVSLLSGVLQVKRSAVAVYSLASVATSGTTQNSGDLTVGPYTEIGIDINTTAQSGTNPTIQYFYERKGADGIYYVLWQSNSLTAATNTLSTSVGAGMAYNQSLGSTGRLRWVIGGTSTPTFTHSLNIYGK